MDYASPGGTDTSTDLDFDKMNQAVINLTTGAIGSQEESPIDIVDDFKQLGFNAQVQALLKFFHYVKLLVFTELVCSNQFEQGHVAAPTPADSSGKSNGKKGQKVYVQPFSTSHYAGA